MSAQQALAQSPEVVVNFVRQLIEEQHRCVGIERRSDERESISVPVMVQPLDDQYEPQGPPFTALTRNLSGGGIGLLHNEPVSNSYIQVRLRNRASETLDVVANVRHCSFQDGHYLIGGRFVIRWDQSP